MQKYRFDKTGPVRANGSIPLYAQWMGGDTLAGVRACPCEDGKSRMVYATGDADTWFSVPAVARIAGKRTKGYLTADENGFSFVAYKPTTGHFMA